MLKTVMTLAVCAVLAVSGLVASKPAEAAPTVPGWYFVSVCTQPADCWRTIYGGAPMWFGPYSDQTTCINQMYNWQTSILGQPPRSLSTCYYQS